MRRAVTSARYPTRGLVERLELRPENVAQKALRGQQHDRRPALTRIAIRPQAVAPGKRNEQLPGPRVSDAELQLDGAAAVRCASVRRPLMRASAASAASRSPGVVAPANRASNLRSLAHSCSSDVTTPSSLAIDCGSPSGSSQRRPVIAVRTSPTKAKAASTQVEALSSAGPGGGDPGRLTDSRGYALKKEVATKPFARSHLKEGGRHRLTRPPSHIPY
jgi:hypothetical protein